MNKILKRIAGVVSCFAILLVAGISLTACGKKEDPKTDPPPVSHAISFKGVNGLKLTDTAGEDKHGTVTVEGAEWKSATVSEEEKQAGVKAAYELTSTTIKKLQEGTSSFFGKDYELVVTWACDGADVTKLKTNSTTDLSKLANLELKAETILEEKDGSVVAKPTNYYWFISVNDAGERKSEAKTIYIAIDWEGNGTKEVYKFVIPANVTLEQA